MLVPQIRALQRKGLNKADMSLRCIFFTASSCKQVVPRSTGWNLILHLHLQLCEEFCAKGIKLKFNHRYVFGQNHNILGWISVVVNSQCYIYNMDTHTRKTFSNRQNFLGHSNVMRWPVASNWPWTCKISSSSGCSTNNFLLRATWPACAQGWE